MVCHQPLAATPPSPVLPDQYQTSNEHLLRQRIDSYSQQPQQLTGQLPVRQQVQANWLQGPYQPVPSQSPMVSQHVNFDDAAPSASAKSDVRDSWEDSPSKDVSDSVFSAQVMWSPQQNLAGLAVTNSNPMLTSGINGIQQLLGETDMPPPAPRLLPAAPPSPPPTAPQQVDSFSLGQQAFGQPLPGSASSFGQYNVNARHPQDFVPPSTTSVGQQLPDGSDQSASANLGDTKRSSSMFRLAAGRTYNSSTSFSHL